MNLKMRKKSIPFQGCHWQTGGLHIVEHLGKNAKIIGRCPEAFYTVYSPGADKADKNASQKTCNGKPHPVDFLFYIRLIRCIIPAF